MYRRDTLKFLALAAVESLVACRGSKESEMSIESDSAAHPGHLDSGASIDSGEDSLADAPVWLHIPELLDPSVDENGVKHFDLRIQASSHVFVDGIAAATYGINSSYLGPTLRLVDGDQVSINYHNELPEPTTMHGHGMHVPAQMDGGPHQLIASGESWSAQYTVKQKACTNWYHPHLMGKTAEQVYMGLSGLIIVEDSESQALALPNRYGVDDIPLILQDRRFDTAGQIDYSPIHSEIMHGYTGYHLVVNGQIGPSFEAHSQLLRFRILNGSNSTVYWLSFDNQHSFHQIGTDNALLEAPVELSRLRLSPGERAELLVSLVGLEGQELVLQNSDGQACLKIVVAPELDHNAIMPEQLTSLDGFEAAAAVEVRRFELSGQQGQLKINGLQMDMGRIDAMVPINQVEIWEIENLMGMDHNFHVHATHFQILDRNGSASAVEAHEAGFKDVVFVPAFETVRIILKMTDYADPEGKYMFHCHFLEHEDAGMMGQFTVIEA